MFFDSKAIGRTSPCLTEGDKSHPTVIPEGSIVKGKGLVRFGNRSTGTVHKATLNFLNASSCFPSHLDSTEGRSSSVNGLAITAYLSIKLR